MLNVLAMATRRPAPRVKRPHVVAVALSHDELEAVDAIARKDGTSRSDAIRLLMRLARHLRDERSSSAA